MINKNVLIKVLRMSPLFILLLFVLIVLIVDSSVLVADNIVLLLIQCSPLIILAITQMVVISSGGLDMSAAFSVSFFVLVFGFTVVNSGSMFIAVVATIAVAMLIGLFNGILIGIFELPSFFVTIASMSIIQGLSLQVITGRTIVISNSSVKFLSVGKVLGVPVPVVYALAISAVFALIIRYTCFGTNVFAMGSNLNATKVNGVNIARMQIKIFIFSAIGASLSAILLASRASLVVAGLGTTNFLLEGVAATIIGGTSSFGGRGSVSGTIIGALIISLLSYCITAFGIRSTSVDMLKGAIVVLALIIETLIDRYSHKLEKSMRVA